MQQTTGCKINVSQPNGRDVERPIGLVGSRGAIEAAKRAIMDKVHAVVCSSIFFLFPFAFAFFSLSLSPNQPHPSNLSNPLTNR